MSVVRDLTVVDALLKQLRHELELEHDHNVELILKDLVLEINKNFLSRRDYTPGLDVDSSDNKDPYVNADCRIAQ